MKHGNITAQLGLLVMLTVTCLWPHWYFTTLSLYGWGNSYDITVSKKCWRGRSATQLSNFIGHLRRKWLHRLRFCTGFVYQFYSREVVSLRLAHLVTAQVLQRWVIFWALRSFFKHIFLFKLDLMLSRWRWRYNLMDLSCSALFVCHWLLCYFIKKPMLLICYVIWLTNSTNNCILRIEMFQIKAQILI